MLENILKRCVSVFGIKTDTCKKCPSEDSHEFATVQEIRFEEDSTGVQITTFVSENGDICTIQKNCKMKNRRNNCYHLLACEECGTIRSICVLQHKGGTYINNSFPEVMPSIPGISGINDKVYTGRWLF